MAKRSWRNFDYLLLGSLLLLSVFGVTMIYSATINTLGVEGSVRRQITYVAGGLLILLVTASLDYRLLEIVQHPFATLTPVVLSLANVAAIIVWRMSQLPDSAETVPHLSTFLPYFPAMLVGTVFVALAFVADRLWIEKIDLPLTRAAAIALVGGAGIAVAWILSRQAPERLTSWTPIIISGGLTLLYTLDCLLLRITDILRDPLYVLMLGLLGTTFVYGQVSGGAQRWLGPGGTIQPSEPSKILTVLVLAKFLADRQDRMERFTTILASIGVVALPALLIYLQPDLGTALTLVAIWVAMMWAAGLRLRHLLLLGGGAVAALPLVWLSLEDYMRQRLTLFINPASDPDSYFNVYHALVSIGSGGWTGKGLTQGTQSQLHFLRVRHTDFIFAVTAEELGFLGSLALMGLLIFILWRTLRVGERARDTFGQLIATGVAAIILFQSTINIGMNLGLMPVTGIPLPFVSYGGSSFLTLMLGMGLVESVAMRHKKLEFD